MKLELPPVGVQFVTSDVDFIIEDDWVIESPIIFRLFLYLSIWSRWYLLLRGFEISISSSNSV